MKYRKQGHCVYYTQYHLVLVAKYRRKIFVAGVMGYLKELLKRIKDYYPDIAISEVKSDEDHVHFLVSIPPKLAVGKVVGIIKANTARELKSKFVFLKKVYWGDDGIWSDGYFVSTVGIDEEIIRKYIERQGQEDSGQAQLEFC
ncbi:MAG: IS200/IS605 family transposase [Bacillota bacterium]